MNVWLTGNINSTGPLVYNYPDKNVIILGKIHSISDISFKVNNLVLLGEIITTESITLDTKADIFNAGSIFAGKLDVVSAGSAYFGISEQIEKIRALGINITRTSSDSLAVRL